MVMPEVGETIPIETFITIAPDRQWVKVPMIPAPRWDGVNTVFTAEPPELKVATFERTPEGWKRIS